MSPNIAAAAPIPRASVTMAMAAKPGFFRSCRSAKRTSSVMWPVLVVADGWISTAGIAPY